MSIVVLLNADSSTAPLGSPVRAADNDAFVAAKAGSQFETMVIGLVKDASIAASASGNVQTDDVLVATTVQWDAVTGQSGGLTPGAVYYLHPTIAGRITSTVPTAVGQFVAPVGIAVSVTELEIHIGTTVLLGEVTSVDLVGPSGPMGPSGPAGTSTLAETLAVGGDGGNQSITYLSNLAVNAGGTISNVANIINADGSIGVGSSQDSGSYAIGAGAKATYSSFAIGLGTAADGSSMACGNAAVAGEVSKAVGAGATASTNSEAYGANASASNHSHAFGAEARAVDHSVAIGTKSDAHLEPFAYDPGPSGPGGTWSSDTYPVWTWNYAAADAANHSIAIGANARATDHAIAFGVNAYGADGSVAVGCAAQATENSLSIGGGAKAKNNSLTIGCVGQTIYVNWHNFDLGWAYTNAADQRSTSIGMSTYCVSDITPVDFGSGYEFGISSNTVLGSLSVVIGSHSTALGTDTYVEGEYSLAIGYMASVLGHFSTLIGTWSTCKGSYTVALGSGLNSAGGHSVGIGSLKTVAGTDDDEVTGGYSTAVHAKCGARATALGNTMLNLDDSTPYLVADYPSMSPDECVCLGAWTGGAWTNTIIDNDTATMIKGFGGAKHSVTIQAVCGIPGQVNAGRDNTIAIFGTVGSYPQASGRAPNEGPAFWYHHQDGFGDGSGSISIGYYLFGNDSIGLIAPVSANRRPKVNFGLNNSLLISGAICIEKDTNADLPLDYNHVKLFNPLGGSNVPQAMGLTDPDMPTTMAAGDLWLDVQAAEHNHTLKMW